MRSGGEARRSLVVSKLAALFVAVAFSDGCRAAPADVGDASPTGNANVTPSALTSASASPIAKDAGAAIDASPRDAAPDASILLHPEAKHVWRQVNTMSWQAVADGPALSSQLETPSEACPEGMVLVSGRYLLDRQGRDDTDEVTFAQDRACTFFRTTDRGVNALCDRFDREKWLEIAQSLPRRDERFCIDRYEYPNQRGEYPMVVATYGESKGYCEAEGKRLCTESEWTFACEGEEGMPYPYGYVRDTTACNIDVLAAPPEDDDTFKPRFTEHTAKGIDFAWQGKRSGESPACKSAFGVYDLTGNVDEWTKTVRKYGYEMIMKGGHWGPGRHRCRPQTRGHGPHYIRYDQGFRCCAGASSPMP